MITINTNKIKQAYKAMRYAEPIHYVVITFWLIFRWRKFRRYSDRLTAGMSWHGAYNDAWLYKTFK